MKKIIGTSSVLLIAGVSIMSSVSADNENTSATGGVEGQMQENRNERMQMNTEIKNDRMKMNQEIRDDRMKMEKKNQTTREINDIRKIGEQKVQQAQRTADSLKKQENKDDRPMMGSGMKTEDMSRPPLWTGELKDFLRNPLTPEEQTALKTLLQAQQAEREAIMKDTTLTPEARTAKLKDLMTAHMTALLTYVSTDKQDAFKKMMEEKMARMMRNQELHKENKDNRQEFKQEAQEKRQEFNKQAQEKRQALSEKLHGQLVAAIEKLNVERLTRILANIEKLVAKIESSTLEQDRKDHFLAQLTEIKTVIQDKIDALNGNSPEGNILSDVLSGVTTNTSGNSTASGTGTTTTTTNSGTTIGTGTTTVTQ